MFFRKRPFITLLQSQKENHEGIAGPQTVNKSVSSECTHQGTTQVQWPCEADHAILY